MSGFKVWNYDLVLTMQYINATLSSEPENKYFPNAIIYTILSLNVTVVNWYGVYTLQSISCVVWAGLWSVSITQPLYSAHWAALWPGPGPLSGVQPHYVWELSGAHSISHSSFVRGIAYSYYYACMVYHHLHHYNKGIIGNRCLINWVSYGPYTHICSVVCLPPTVL